MALQYVELCKGNCSNGNAVNCQPPEDDFTEVFAPNCGVELATVGTITGHIVGCQSKHVEPSLAFSNVLVRPSESDGLNHSEPIHDPNKKGSDLLSIGDTREGQEHDIWEEKEHSM
ncbi:hypothetical protein Patl1_00044 [Pistacia atlantica]|uniref:Uncharacterized protein n=1 Tax=Pistacia atlantica TaxID=434234 RepID=A0ACC1C722_9ROSI|nr:hypothetical protein Patl1_00044 [Pistacia atlantica]